MGRVRDGDRRPAWLRSYHPSPAAPVRLVCLPHAGGSAGAFRDLSELLAPRVDVVSVQYPGRQDRMDEPCVDSIAGLADGVWAALDSAGDDRPLALFGHSMGAVVAYETARRATGSGPAPLRLFVSGSGGPTTITDDGVHLRDDEELLAEVDALAGTPSQVLADRELLQLILPSIRADYRAVETYRHLAGPPLSCPIDALLGDAEPDVTDDELGAWAGHTSASFTSTLFPGGHFYLADRPDTVAELIRQRLVERPTDG